MSLLIIVCECIALHAFAAEPVRYVGVDKCKICHSDDNHGNEYKQWKATAHSQAWETLGSPQAQEVARKQGIDNPQQAEECLVCHTVEGAPDPQSGVGCEGCHGKFSSFDAMKGKVMMGHDALDDGALQKVNEGVCLKCHNPQSPTYRGFDYELARPKILHLH